MHLAWSPKVHGVHTDATTMSCLGATAGWPKRDVETVWKADRIAEYGVRSSQEVCKGMLCSHPHDRRGGSCRSPALELVGRMLTEQASERFLGGSARTDQTLREAAGCRVSRRRTEACGSP